MAVFHQLQHIVALSQIELFQSPVVKQQDVSSGQLSDELGEASVMMCDRQCLQKT